MLQSRLQTAKYFKEFLMQRVLVFLSGNQEKDEKTKTMLETVSDKVLPLYTFEGVGVFESMVGLSLPYVFYKGLRFSEVLGIREFVRYITSEKNISYSR